MPHAPPKPHVTLFADASVQPAIMAAGYGFWIKGDNRESSWAGGPLKSFTKDTCVAELEALAIAIYRASEAGYFRDTDEWILLQCDNIEALEALRVARPRIIDSRHRKGLRVEYYRHRKLRPLCKERVDFILQILDKHKLNAMVRHVKGHKDSSVEGRNWVNNLCDRLAKQGAKEQRVVT